MTIAVAMLKLMLPMALGYFLFRIGILNTDADARMSKLIIYVTSPCLIFESVMELEATMNEKLTLLLVGVVIYAFLIAAGFLTAFLLRVPENAFNTYVCLLVMGNVGFMGLPLASSLMGTTGLAYMGILNIHFTLTAYSFGKVLMSRTSGSKSAKFRPMDVVNAATVTGVLTLIFFLLDVDIPDIVMEPISFMGQVTSPLAMIILGGTLASFSLKNMFTEWRYYVVSAIRLIVFPIITFFMMRAIWGVTEMTIIATIYTGMPTATVVNMLALAYDGDSKNASGCTGLMSILSLVTLPVMWILINSL